MKKLSRVLVAAAFFLSNITAMASAPILARAENQIQPGTVVRSREFPTLYYIGADGKRYVFPNEHAYFSWFDDFSGISEVETGSLSQFAIGGNIQYKPGAVLVKIKTDPKVYAVGKNGVLHWVKTEDLAKKLYGEKWNLLIDDVPDVFFVNYSVGTVIENENDFDPDEEEDAILGIDDNLGIRVQKKIEKRIEKNLDLCVQSQERINKIQKRLLRRGIKVEGVADDFFQKCVSGVVEKIENTPDNSRGKGKGKEKKGHERDEDEDDDDDDEDDKNDKKIVICHIPPGNAGARQTLIVGVPSARAHLSHGDTLGLCGNGNQNDTQPPVISGVTATSTSSNAAKVQWKTNEASTSKVTYATQSIATATSTQSVSNVTLLTDHAIMLSGLFPSTQYFFIALSLDASGNTATSTEMTFTTLAASSEPDTTPPQISNIRATSTTQTQTTIQWSTNEPATSIVEYASSALSSATSTQTLTNTALATSHSMTLLSLTASTTYHYRVKSKDASGNTAVSEEKTFITQTPEDTAPPLITAIITTARATSTDILWTTNEQATSKVIYATQSLSTATTTQTISESALATSHMLTLLNLTPSTQYFFKIESKDLRGNTATSAEQTFTTTP